jgi:WD40 repeat protein
MPDGLRVVSGSSDQTLRVWDLKKALEVATLHGHASGVTTCAVTPDEQHMISGSEDRTLKVWGLVTGREIATLLGHAGGGCA